MILQCCVLSLVLTIVGGGTTGARASTLPPGSVTQIGTGVSPSPNSSAAVDTNATTPATDELSQSTVVFERIADEGLHSSSLNSVNLDFANESSSEVVPASTTTLHLTTEVSVASSDLKSRATASDSDNVSATQVELKTGFPETVPPISRAESKIDVHSSSEDTPSGEKGSRDAVSSMSSRPGVTGDALTVSTSGWIPIPDPRIRPRQGRVSQGTPATPSLPPPPKPRPTIEPFNFSEEIRNGTAEEGSNGSVPLVSSSGWRPVLQRPLPQRQGRMRVVYEEDYDDIITAPPTPLTFDVVVSANLNGDSPSQSSKGRPPNEFRQGRIKIVDSPNAGVKKRARSAHHLDFGPHPEDGFTGISYFPSPTEMTSHFRTDKVVVPRPMHAGGPVAVDPRVLYIPEFGPEDIMPSSHDGGSHTDIMYIPLHETTRVTHPNWKNEEDDDDEEEIVTDLPRQSIINRLFTLPPITLNANGDHGLFHSSTHRPPMLSAGTRRVPFLITSHPPRWPQFVAPTTSPTTPSSSEVPSEPPTPRPGNPPSTRNILHTFSSITPLRGYSVPERNGSRRRLDSEATAEKPGTEEKGRTVNSSSSQPIMSTESLAYILIGTCCGLSIVCLLVVIVTMRCRRSLGERKAFDEVRHTQFINGWASEPFPTGPALTYDNDFAQATNFGEPFPADRGGTITSWAERKLTVNPLVAAAAQEGAGTTSANGIRFETLRIGPSKQLKRTTVIPAHSTALLTDGHTAVMRELSSISSGSSADSRRSLCGPGGFPSLRVDPEDVSESLEIQEELFDQARPSTSAYPAVARPCQPRRIEPDSLDPTEANRPAGENGKRDDATIHWTSNDERLI